MNNFMNDRQYFMTTSLSYQLKAAQQELASFRSGEIYVKLRADYEKIIREQNMTIQKLQKERDDFSFSRKKITQQWMEVLEDVEKEYEKEIKKLKPVLFMLNSRCNVSLAKTAQFVSDHEVLGHFATGDENNLFQSVKEIFKRPNIQTHKKQSDNYRLNQIEIIHT